MIDDKVDEGERRGEEKPSGYGGRESQPCFTYFDTSGLIAVFCYITSTGIFSGVSVSSIKQSAVY